MYTASPNLLALLVALVISIPTRAAAVVNVLAQTPAEARAQQWLKSPNPIVRSNALNVLRLFRSPENVALLRTMLDDPFTTATTEWPDHYGTVYPADTPWRGHLYPLRRKAYLILKEWGEQPAEAVFYQRKYPATHLPAWAPLALLLGATGLLAVTLLLGRLGPLRRWAGLTCAITLLLLLSACLWARSHWRIDQFAFRSAADVRYELASLNGTLRVMRIEQWPEPTPVAFTTTPRTAASLADWVPPPPAKRTRRNAITPQPTPPPSSHLGGYGFTAETGSIEGANGTPEPFSAYAVPWWSLCAPLALLSGIRLRRAHRRHRRQSNNCCLACGYDLRATPTRCPECGGIPKAA